LVQCEKFRFEGTHHMVCSAKALRDGNTIGSGKF